MSILLCHFGVVLFRSQSNGVSSRQPRQSAICLALQHGHTELASLLIDRGCAALNVTDPVKGTSPLTVAVVTGQVKVSMPLAYET